MKTKSILALALALSLSAAAVVSASAATLTNTSPDGSAEVTARIEGAGPGEVSYIITIPDKVDFGVLTQPSDTTSDHFKDVSYTVTATEINNLPENNWVSVRVKDENADLENDQFYIMQTTAPNTKLTYDVFDGLPSEGAAVNTGDMGENGYLLTAFNSTGQKIDGTLRLNQNQIYGKSLDEIAGDYSGHMVFHSSLITV